MRTVGIATLALALLPQLAAANVEFSEIVWMGSTANPNAEWIELQNTGSEAVSLDGWSIRAADGTPNITLLGSIGAGGFFLLERTSDETVPDKAADQIYTGALGNDGEILELVNANGSVVDRIDGASSWELGGDNTTKETLQRVSGSWVTAVATPRATNSAARSEWAEAASAEPGAKEAEVGASSGSAEKYSGMGKPVIVREKESAGAQRAANTAAQTGGLSQPRLNVEIGGDRVATVGTRKRFVAHAYDSDGEEILSARFEWNFGDGTVRRGREVTHRYLFPGDYSVSLTVTREEFREKLTATDRARVSAIGADVAILTATNSYIEIANREEREVDLSDWILQSGSAAFRIPAGTVLLPGASVRFPKRATGLSVRDPLMTALNYPGGSRAITYAESRLDLARQEREEAAAAGASTVTERPATQRARAKPAQRERVAPLAPSRAMREVPREAPLSAPRAVEPVPIAEPALATATSPVLAAAHASIDPESELYLWLLGLLGLVGIAAVGAFYLRADSVHDIRADRDT